MRDGTRLNPEVVEMVERSLRARASRPVPNVEGRAGGASLLGEDAERQGRLVGSARLGMVPMLVDGEEWYKHKDGLVPEDLPLMVAWHEAEAAAWDEKAERAQFACDVLRDLEGSGPTGREAGPELAADEERGHALGGSSLRALFVRLAAFWLPWRGRM